MDSLRWRYESYSHLPFVEVTAPETMTYGFWALRRHKL
jgi:hypothetical protein